MKAIDGNRIRSAIRAAEDGTTGRIGVHVTRERIPDALEHARLRFNSASSSEHPRANAVLFIIAPKSRKFAVYGGEAIHARVSETFWKQLVAQMTPYFAQDCPTDGLVLGIACVGDELRAHFPFVVNA